MFGLIEGMEQAANRSKSQREDRWFRENYEFGAWCDAATGAIVRRATEAEELAWFNQDDAGRDEMTRTVCDVRVVWCEVRPPYWRTDGTANNDTDLGPWRPR